MAKENKDNYGNYIIDNKEHLLRKKKQKLIIKRSIIFMILLLVLLITLGLTLPIFNLQKVAVEGNEKVTTEEIEALAALEYGSNIFKIRNKEVASRILQNSYISEATVKRKVPNTLVLKVSERESSFYIQGESGVYIIDETGKVLEKKEKLDDPFLLRLVGIPEEKLVVGETIKDLDEKNFDALKFIHEFIKENNLLDRYSITMLEINDFIALKLYINNLYIKIGTTDDLFNKLSRGFNVLNTPDVTTMKGYIDVSFDGNPVICKE